VLHNRSSLLESPCGVVNFDQQAAGISAIDARKGAGQWPINGMKHCVAGNAVQAASRVCLSQRAPKCQRWILSPTASRPSRPRMGRTSIVEPAISRWNHRRQQPDVVSCWLPKLFFKIADQLRKPLFCQRVVLLSQHPTSLFQPPLHFFTVALFGHGDTPII
jgi:hypothetical protein